MNKVKFLFILVHPNNKRFTCKKKQSSIENKLKSIYILLGFKTTTLNFVETLLGYKPNKVTLQHCLSIFIIISLELQSMRSTLKFDSILSKIKK